MVDYTIKQIILPFLMKYQFHTPHLVETHMCNLLKLIYLKYGYVILIEICMHEQNRKGC